MSRNLLRAGALSCALLASTSLVAPAFAQTPPPAQPNFNLDRNGVDLTEGSFNFSQQDLSIGPEGIGGLSYGRTYGRGGWSSNMRIFVDERTISGQQYAYVTHGNASDVFVKSGSVWVSTQQRGSTLTQVGGAVRTYTYRSAEGVEYGFTVEDASNAVLSRVDYIQHPSGERLTFHYRRAIYRIIPCSTMPCPFMDLERLQSVTSNRGYQLHFTYATDLPTNMLEWRRVTQVRGINNAVDYCNPTALTCTGLTYSWPTATYGESVSGGDTIYTATDPLGRTTTFTQGSSGFRIRRPSSGSDTTVVTFGTSGVTSVVNNGETWSYAYSDVGSTRTTTVTDPLSGQRVVVSDMTIGRPTSDTDATGRTTSYQYGTNGRVSRITQPEGNYTQYSYDARGNITERRAVAKASSGLADIVTSSTFPATCTNPVTCNLPTSVTDPRGNVTDYTYDSGHGGLLTMTAPSPGGGAPRPQVRYAYTSTQAWYKNSAGTIVASGVPIQLPTAASTCAVGSAPSCVGTANETRTTVTYGATGVANGLPAMTGPVA